MQFSRVYFYFCRLYKIPVNMRLLNLLTIIFVISYLASCTGGKQITTTMQNGQAFWQEGQYEQALKSWEEVIVYYEKKDEQKECPVYAKAAGAAYKLGKTEKTISYLIMNQNSDYANANTYYDLAALYKQTDNLSKELEELEAYEEKFPEGDKLTEVHIRLFEIYVEIKSWEKAGNVWQKIPDLNKSNTVILEKYFLLNKALDNDSVCDATAGILLQYDESNLTGLDWLAKKYFWQAEHDYHDELKAYDKNKTVKQYKKLLKVLDEVTVDFKTSLGYFERLYILEPNPATAKYMGDIYNRLDDDKKAEYYYNLAE